MDNNNGSVKYSVSLDDSKMSSDASHVINTFNQIGQTAEQEGSRIDKAFSTAAANIGKAFAAIGIAGTLQELSKKILTVRGDFQKLEVAFEVMLGSADKANTLMKQLVQTAATTPFDLQGVANGAKQLLAYGVSADEVNDTLIRLGNIASGLSIPLNDLVMLYGTTMTQGRLFTQDLRQFMGRGIPLADELAKQFGVAKDKVGDLVTAGKVGFPQVKKAIEDLTNEGGKFAGLMDKQSKTIAGQISNIGDAIDGMFNDLGKKNEGVINDALSAVSYLIEHYETLGKVLLTLVATYGTYKAALMATVAIQKSKALMENIQLMMMFRKELGLATAAQQAFNITAKANPYALIASGLALVITSLTMFADSTDDAADKEDNLNNIREQAAEKVAEEKSEIETLVAAARNEKLSLDQRKIAIQKLNKQIPNYNAYLNETTQKYYENKDALDAYLDSLQRMYELEGAKDVLKDLGKKIAKNAVDIKMAEQKVRDATAKDNEVAANTGGVYAYGLSAKAEDELKKLKKEREDLNKQKKAVQSVYGEDLQNQATGGKKKGGKTTTSTYADDVKKARQKYQKANKELKALIKDRHSTTQAVKQARADVEQAEKDLKDLTGETPSQTAKTAKAKQTAADKAHKDVVNARKENAEYAETQREIAQDKIKQAQQNELEVRQAEIDAQENSTKKQIEQIKLDRDKKLAEIEDEYKQLKEKKIQQAKQLWEANPKHDETPFKLNENDPAYAYTDDEKKLRQTKIDAVNKDYNDKMQALEEQRLQFLQDYLKQYGTLQEQKYAIAKEYDAKIAKAEDEYQKKSLEREKQNALADADAKNLSLRIDWSGTFGNVGKVLKDVAIDTLKQVEEYMKTDEFKALGADQKKTYSDLRTRLQQETGSDSTSPFNFKIWGQIEQQVKAYQNSVKELLAAQKKHTEAVDQLAAAENWYKGAKDNFTKAIAKFAVDEAKKNVETTANEQTDAQEKADKAKTDLTDSTNKAAQGIQNFTNYLGEMTNGSLSGFANGISKLVTSLAKGSDGVGKSLGELGGKIGGIIGAILQIIDALGDDPEQFINDLFDKITNTVDKILSDLPSLVINVVHDVGNLVVGVFEGIGSMFGAKDGWINGSNAKEVKELTDKLTKSNDRLQNSIERLKDSIDKTGGVQAVKDYQQAYKDEQDLIKNTMAILQAQMGYHDHHHSNNYYWGKSIGSADYAAINETLAQYALNNPTAKTTRNSVASLQDIYQLTPEQMQAIADHNVDIWTKMLDAGKYDKSEYWENYIELAGKLEELTEQINENLTQVSFDSLKSDFVDDIMDMSKTASDFSKDFTKMIAKAWTNAAVSNLMQKDLQNFYNNWADRMKDADGLSKEDIAELKKQYDALVSNAISIRDDMTKITGYTGDESSQEASSGAWQSMSEETGEELNGRFTAIQSTTVMIYEQIKLNAASIATISQTSGQNFSVLSEMNNLVLTCSEYLQRIVTNTDVLPNMNRMIEKIKINTDKL